MGRNQSGRAIVRRELLSPRVFWPFPNSGERRHHRWNPQFWLCLLLLAWVSSLLSCGGGAGGEIAVVEPKKGGFYRGEIAFEFDLSGLSKPIRAGAYLFSLTDQLGNKIIPSKDSPFSEYVWELKKVQNPPEYWKFSWDSREVSDGSYRLEVQVLTGDGRIVRREVSPVWILNSPVKLKIRQCENSPIFAKDRLFIEVVFDKRFSALPPATVEVLLDGVRTARKSAPPYKFGLDLRRYPEGKELHLSAAVAEGIFSGASDSCSVLIDRRGPEVKFVYPSKEVKTVPAKFSAVIDVSDESGVAEVWVTADGKRVGSVSSPPFVVPVVLKGVGFDRVVQLRAWALDYAGNQTKSREPLSVRVDPNPPKVEILSPKKFQNYMGEILFKCRITDESGLKRIDYYITDGGGQRLDNILHLTEGEIRGDTFQVRLREPLRQYGPGDRRFQVVAVDKNGNSSFVEIPIVLGCVSNKECEKISKRFQCISNRCIIPRQLGEVCSKDVACAPQWICHFGGISWCSKSKLGICRKPCRLSSDCRSGYFCLRTSGGSGVCFPGDPCSPLTSNCSQSEQCTPWGRDSFVCLPVGRRLRGQWCQPYSCSPVNNCVRGLVCVPSRGSSAGRCWPLCRLGSTFPRDCPSPFTCNPFPLADGSRNSLGYCSR